MAVVIPLKLVYTPVDATVTAIRNYQVPSTKKDKTRGGHGAVRRCLVKGSVLRSVACLPTHPVLPIAPSQRIYIILRDSRIYMGIYMCGDIYGSMYVWRRE